MFISVTALQNDSKINTVYKNTPLYCIFIEAATGDHYSTGASVSLTNNSAGTNTNEIMDIIIILFKE